MQVLILPILLLTNLGLVFALAAVYQKYRRVKSASAKASADKRKKTEEILEAAKEKSLEIISHAYERAGEVSIDSKEAYKNALEGARKQIAKIVTSEIGEFTTNLEKETFATESEVKEKISQDYLKLEGELEDYKTKKLEEIEALSLKIAKEAVSRFLGSSISLDVHRDLIVKSLEEAKKANVFK